MKQKYDTLEILTKWKEWVEKLISDIKNLQNLSEYYKQILTILLKEKNIGKWLSKINDPKIEVSLVDILNENDLDSFLKWWKLSAESIKEIIKKQKPEITKKILLSQNIDEKLKLEIFKNFSTNPEILSILLAKIKSTDKKLLSYIMTILNWNPNLRSEVLNLFISYNDSYLYKVLSKTTSKIIGEIVKNREHLTFMNKNLYIKNVLNFIIENNLFLEKNFKFYVSYFTEKKWHHYMEENIVYLVFNTQKKDKENIEILFNFL